MTDAVSVYTFDKVVENTINRPPANAINTDVSNTILEALTMLQDNDDYQVGIITGSGDYIFSAGWDLKEIARTDNNEEAVNEAFQCPGGFAGLTEL